MKISIAIAGSEQTVEAAAQSKLQKEYRTYFKKKLKDAGGVDALKDEDSAADFFGSISDEWSSIKADKGL